MINWIKRLLRKKEPSQDRQPTSAKTTKIWGVLGGPIHRDEIPEEELLAAGIPPDAEAMLVCRIEEDGEIGFVNYWYPSFDDAYEVKKYFDVNIEPLEVTYDD